MMPRENVVLRDARSSARVYVALRRDDIIRDMRDDDDAIIAAAARYKKERDITDDIIDARAPPRAAFALYVISLVTRHYLLIRFATRLPPRTPPRREITLLLPMPLRDVTNVDVALSAQPCRQRTAPRAATFMFIWCAAHVDAQR